jgi:hypothetical protein
MPEHVKLGEDSHFCKASLRANRWLISPPCPHPLPYHPLRPLPLPPSIPSRNYFALISNFVVERVEAIIGRNKGFCWLR